MFSLSYSQATMTKMIARCTQQGQSIDQAIAWASDEIEGGRERSIRRLLGGGGYSGL